MALEGAVGIRETSVIPREYDGTSSAQSPRLNRLVKVPPPAWLEVQETKRSSRRGGGASTGVELVHPQLCRPRPICGILLQLSPQAAALLYSVPFHRLTPKLRTKTRNHAAWYNSQCYNPENTKHRLLLSRDTLLHTTKPVRAGSPSGQRQTLDSHQTAVNPSWNRRCGS